MEGNRAESHPTKVGVSGAGPRGWLVGMDPEQIHLVRRSFALVERQKQVAALVFYRRLFSADPSVRPLFRHDIEEQGRKLMETLAGAVSMLEQPAALAAELERLGARHAGYGVRTEHYATVGGALLGMLSDVLGPGFTAEVRSAWSALYGFLSDAMLRGAETAPERPAALRPPAGTGADGR